MHDLPFDLESLRIIIVKIKKEIYIVEEFYGKGTILRWNDRD